MLIALLFWFADVQHIGHTEFAAALVYQRVLAAEHTLQWH
jgi:hypothetical protein